MIKQGYKPTEIGVIPEDWEYDFAGPYLDFLTGFPFKSDEFSNHGTKLLRGSNVKRNEIVWNEDLNRYWENIDHSLTKYLLKEGDIVISMDGSLVGRSFGQITNSDLPCLLVQRVARLRGVKIHTNYLKQYYCSDFFTSHCDNNKTSSAIPHISPKDILEFKIAFPKSLAEQEAIASALSDADAWIENLEQLIAKKRLIKQGAMQTLLTPPSEEPVLSGVEPWEVKKLGEVGKTYGGLSGKTKVDFGKGNAHYIPFMNVMKNVVIDKSFFEKVNLKQGEVQNKVLKNDLLFNGSSETPEELGISSVILEEIDNLYLNSFCFGFRLFDNNVNPLFLSYLFRSPYGRKIIFYLAQGATRYNLSKANFLELEISIPKSLSEQERIATILSDMDAELEALETKLGKARQIKQGMMQELLTGRTRLV